MRCDITITWLLAVCKSFRLAAGEVLVFAVALLSHKRSFMKLAALCARGVKFRSLTTAINIGTPMGRAVWQMTGVVAELDH